MPSQAHSDRTRVGLAGNDRTADFSFQRINIDCCHCFSTFLQNNNVRARVYVEFRSRKLATNCNFAIIIIRLQSLSSGWNHYHGE